MEETRTPLERRLGRDTRRVQGDGDTKAVVFVRHMREGAHFEIPVEPHLTLDVYYHPFAYWNLSTVQAQRLSCRRLV